MQLPAQLSCCTKLADMRISTAQLPTCVFNVISLTLLLLDQARPAPDNLQAAGRLTCLQEMRICHSDAAMLEAALAEMTAAASLTTLRLDRNELTSLPEIAWLPQLKVLDLKHNECAPLPLPHAVHVPDRLWCGAKRLAATQ